MTEPSRIRVRCSACGDLYLAPDRVWVVVTYAGPTYQFTCPGCAAVIIKAISPRIVELLVRHGCPSNRPSELDESHGGPPLTPDDLLDFCLTLYGTDWSHELHA